MKLLSVSKPINTDYLVDASLDKMDRGVGFFAGKLVKFDELVNPVDVKTYFHKEDDNADVKLSYFKVDLSPLVTDNEDLVNICVANKNKCK